VLQAPRAVFAAMRDDSDESARARQEPILALVLLAGIALTLMSATSDTFADDPARAGIVIPVWLFVAGGLAGLINYWLGGGVLYLAVRELGGEASYRQARHVFGFALAPLALSLVLLPLRLALYGGDIFESGGRDRGAGPHVFAILEGAFAVWALVLLAVGIRTVFRWSWARTAVGLVVAGGLAALLDLGLSLF
jgi:hypothetical protein